MKRLEGEQGLSPHFIAECHAPQKVIARDPDDGPGVGRVLRGEFRQCTVMESGKTENKCPASHDEDFTIDAGLNTFAQDGLEICHFHGGGAPRSREFSDGTGEWVLGESSQGMCDRLKAGFITLNHFDMGECKVTGSQSSCFIEGNDADICKRFDGRPSTIEDATACPTCNGGEDC